MARDTSFYYSFLALSPERRQAIVAVWDFCRAVDDAVDEAGTETGYAEARVAEWRDEVDRVFSRRPPHTPQGRALAPVVARYGIPRGPFDELVAGVAMDVGARRYPTFADLREYCYRVASTVGLMCLPIFGCRPGVAEPYAIELGVALQLTNILRDVGVDLARGRLYLPLEDLERFACGEADLRRGTVTPAVRALLAHHAARAREHFARARAALPREEARRLVAAEIMGAIYQALLRRIERRGFDVFSQVVRVPRTERALLAATTWARVQLRGA